MMARLTAEQAAACDAYAQDRSNRNYTKLDEATMETHADCSEPLADRVADLLDELRQAERDRDALAGAMDKFVEVLKRQGWEVEITSELASILSRAKGGA